MERTRFAVPREAEPKLDRFRILLASAAETQNLVSKASLTDMDVRHIQDALQLVPYLRGPTIVEIGSGAGIPGMILAIATDHRFVLTEPRAKRAAFLASVADDLALTDRVAIVQRRVERITTVAATTIVARAVAPLDRLFGMAAHMACDTTRWVLPKGRSARAELDRARATWQGRFELIPSVTDPDASIVLAEGVRRRPT